MRLVTRVSSILLAIILIAIIPLANLGAAQQVQPGPASDQITFIRVAIEQVPDAIKNNQIDMYYFALRPLQAQKIQQDVPNAVLYQAPAGLIDLILNPAPVSVITLNGTLTIKQAAAALGVPLAAIVGFRTSGNQTIVELGANPNTSSINPFAFKQIRWAMNYLVDRDTIVSQILKGFGVPMYTFLSQYDPTYTIIADIVARYEFRYDPSYADSIITSVLTSVGAQKIGGVWYYGGKPIAINFVIRVEDERNDIGNMVATDLKLLGFTVNVLPMRFTEAINTVYATDPMEFAWHIYTEGWGKGGITRWDTATVAQFSAPWFGYMPGWQEPTFWNYQNDTIDDLTLRIYTGNFTSQSEFVQLYRKATEMAIQESVRVWIATRLDTWVTVNQVQGITLDLGAGLRGIWNVREAFIPGKPALTVGHLWVYTAGDAWNYWGGFSSVYYVDQMYATYDPLTWNHPFNGEPMPFRTPYVVQTAGPTGKLDVPSNAIIWDVNSKKWVPVPSGTKATSMVIFDLSKLVGTKWHNGMTITMADVVAAWAYAFDITYDSKYSALEPRIASNLKPTLDLIKGLVFDAQNKRLIVYIDYWFFDTNYIAAMATLGIANPLEIHTVTWQLALDQRNQTSLVLYQRKGYQWFSLVYPDHVALVKNTLATYLNNQTVFAKANAYANGLLTMDEWNARIQADLNWINAHGHAWISQGPFYMDKFDKDAQTAVYKAFRDPTYPFKKGDWYFGKPITTLIGGYTLSTVIPGKILPGSPANLTVIVNGIPPLHLEYILKDAAGNILSTGDAAQINQTAFLISFPSDFTINLDYRTTYYLILLAYSDIVAMPDMKKIELTTASTAEALQYMQSLNQEALNKLQSALNQQISSVYNQINQLNSQLTQLNSTLTAMLGQQIQTVMTALTQNIKTVSDVLTNLANVVNTTQATLTNFQSSTNSQFSSISSDLSSIKSTLASMQTTLQGAASASDVEALKSQVSTLQNLVYATLGLVVVTLIVSGIGLARRK
ncbi:LPXTG-motif cell wall anchor domain protein [Thermogladius calderae 1633]|uniref:LPXTG-motif cell wall anchor domain protein n=2 Tax=Thermogladius calderae TaxID=1200300 RepID=I3TGD5_THEC1|nr:LPXTG-motif cell wall anchor domain protein [Thermogladius calderae 1633]